MPPTNGKIKLNLGCGKDYRPGWYNIDISPEFNPDILHDLSTGIPFDDDTVNFVYAHHFLEHIEDTIFIMNEIWRVCRDGAKVEIEVPHQSSLMAFADPTHKRIFNEESFKYYCSNAEHYWIHESYGIKCDFTLKNQKVLKHKRHGYVRVWLEANK